MELPLLIWGNWVLQLDGRVRNGPGSGHLLLHPRRSLRKCPRPRPRPCRLFSLSPPTCLLSHSLLWAFRPSGRTLPIEPHSSEAGVSCPLEGFSRRQCVVWNLTAPPAFFLCPARFSQGLREVKSEFQLHASDLSLSSADQGKVINGRSQGLTLLRGWVGLRKEPLMEQKQEQQILVAQWAPAVRRTVYITSNHDTCAPSGRHYPFGNGHLWLRGVQRPPGIARE